MPCAAPALISSGPVRSALTALCAGSQIAVRNPYLRAVGLQLASDTSRAKLDNFTRQVGGLVLPLFCLWVGHMWLSFVCRRRRHSSSSPRTLRYRTIRLTVHCTALHCAPSASVNRKSNQRLRCPKRVRYKAPSRSNVSSLVCFLNNDDFRVASCVDSGLFSGLRQAVLIDSAVDFRP